MNKPTIVCLCGSTRFQDAFLAAAKRETLAGKIVLSVGCFDALYLKKINMADEILVLNVGGYIGESTAHEIFYALGHGKPVRLLEPSVLEESKRRLNKMLTVAMGHEIRNRKS
jgi:nucleoside 2-deoxyribosyltransferase